MKTFRVIDRAGSHEYDIKVIEKKKSTKFKLYRSNKSEWMNPKEHVMTLSEDHSLFVKLPKLKRKIGADVAVELNILLKFSILYGQEKYVDELTFDAISSKGTYTI